MGIFKNIFKKKKKEEWLEFDISIKHIITDPELSPDSPIKDFYIPYRFRYCPETKILQKGKIIILEKMRSQFNIDDWVDVDINKYNGAVCKPMSFREKIIEISEKYYNDHRAEFRDKNIDDLLKN